MQLIASTAFIILRILSLRTNYSHVETKHLINKDLTYIWNFKALLDMQCLILSFLYTVKWRRTVKCRTELAMGKTSGGGHISTWLSALEPYWLPQPGPPRAGSGTSEKKIGPGSKRVTNLHIKSEKQTFSCRVSWEWTEWVTMYTRQMMIIYYYYSVVCLTTGPKPPPSNESILSCP